MARVLSLRSSSLMHCRSQPLFCNGIRCSDPLRKILTQRPNPPVRFMNISPLREEFEEWKKELNELKWELQRLKGEQLQLLEGELQRLKGEQLERLEGQLQCLETMLKEFRSTTANHPWIGKSEELENFRRLGGLIATGTVFFGLGYITGSNV